METLHSQMAEMNDAIWEFAECRFEEVKSSALQIAFLKKEGFEITEGLAGMKTAFKARYGSKHPTCGLLGEYDALPEIGHACGHNTLGTASLAAAVQIKQAIASGIVKGSVVYFGCPAEESGGGKVYMVRDDVFDEVDFVLTWHPGPVNSVMADGFLANIKVNYTFKGIASHAAASPELGRSALDAVELMNIGVNFLREHMIDGARIHYAITNAGGDAPNIVQSLAEALYIIRAPKSNQVYDLFERVNKVAKGAALMTETEVTPKVIMGYSDFIANPTLSKIMHKHLQTEAAKLKYRDDELLYAKNIRAKMQNPLTIPGMPPIKAPILTTVLPSPEYLPGSSDVGDVSWVKPTAQFLGVCYAFGTAPHSTEQVEQGRSSIVHKGLMMAANVLSKTAIEVMSDSQQLNTIIEEFNEQHISAPYRSLLPKEVKINA